MSGWGSRLGAARLLCAAAAAPLAAGASRTRKPRRPPPAPAAARCGRARSRALRSTPMPDLGVAWPDSTPGTRRRRRPTAAPRHAPKHAAESRPPTNRRSSATPCRSKGFGAIGNAEDLLRQFRQQSCARSRAQGPRQRRADRPPGERRRRPARPNCFARQGYYDADVEPRTEKAGEPAARRPDRRSRASNIASRRSSCRASTRPVRTRRKLRDSIRG